jgi:hypothetical protein
MKEQEFLNLRIAHFIRRYKPKDEYEAQQFEAELIGFIRTAHMQATEPFVRRYNAMTDNMLPSSLLSPATKKS